MNPAFQYSSYLLKRQVLALTGKLRFYNPDGNLVLFAQQKMFRLREDIRIYGDEAKGQELLLIKARNIIDWAAAYDVVDPVYNQKVGVLRRKGWRSMMRDEWEVLDASDQPIGMLFEDSVARALLRRLLLGSFLPQDYDLTVGEMRVADLRQKFTLFGYQMLVDFSMDTANRLDHRLGIAAAVLLAVIEGKQQS
ncbi:MAG: hypothetical protein JXB85_02605 [Anaerolineales bacterium]|nr:hypothetical protein [Anaerolineales bacterium]